MARETSKKSKWEAYSPSSSTSSTPDSSDSEGNLMINPKGAVAKYLARKAKTPEQVQVKLKKPS